MRTERGDLENAYIQARDLLRRHPENGDAHFTMGYVFRYAGLLSEGARECEAARAIDPHNSGWRSCSMTFMYLGDLARAKQYIDLDAGSVWSRSVETILSRACKKGDRAEMLRVAESGAMNRTRMARWLPMFALLDRPAPKAGSISSPGSNRSDAPTAR